MTVAFVFPGQGSQVVGMGKELAEASAEARYVFEEVSDAVGKNLTKLIFEGPEDKLTLTENAQPALMAVSMAAVRVLERDCGIVLPNKVRFVAGHSLGEYSALAAIKSISLSDAARLLAIRGRAMQQAVPVGEGAMAALLGLDMETVRKVGENSSNIGICMVANDNAPGQIVISGSVAAIEKAMELAKEYGARRTIILPVSAPFHCSMMAPAAKIMEEVLADVEICKPSVALIANVLASEVEDFDKIRSLLVEQVTKMVRWTESVEYMCSHGVEKLIEIGAGKVLSGLARRINRDLQVLNVSGPEDLDPVLREL